MSNGNFWIVAFVPVSHASAIDIRLLTKACCRCLAASTRLRSCKQDQLPLTAAPN